MTRLALLLALVLSGCWLSSTEPCEPKPCDHCRHLENDVVRDSLLPLPDSVP